MWLEPLARDARYALRSARTTPGFAATAIVMLALGIGANTAVFTVLNAVVLRPLQYPVPEQLVHLTTEFPSLKFAKYGFSPPEYLEFRDAAQSFTDVGAFMIGEMNLTASDRPLRVRSAAVNDRLVHALGIRAGHGRLFTRDETETTSSQPPLVAILSDELWRTAFGGQPLVGRTVELEGRPYEVVGIMAAGADVMDNRVEVWLPLGLNPGNRQLRASHYLGVIGRLKDGVSAQAARTELGAMVENWGVRFGVSGAGIGGHVPTNRPAAAADHVIKMEPVQTAMLGDAGRAIWLVQAAVGLVLLIACANLANLLMARAETRRREYAVRTALGASPGQLLRQAMTEGVLLSLVGGVLGVWFARAGVQALIRTYPTSLPRTSEVAVDARVLLFALAVMTATGVLFGLAPAVLGHTIGVATTLKESGGNSGGATAGYRLRRVLVAGEVALAVMLVMCAGLLVRSVYNLIEVDAGFDRSRLVTFSLTLPPSQATVRAQAYQRLLDRLRAEPGVQRATAMSGLPPNRPANGTGTIIENHTAPTGEPFEVVDYYQYVMSDYFETMGIPIVAGRSFERTDLASSGRVAVINETFMSNVWKGQSPLGQRLRPTSRSEVPWSTVIGVAKDVKQGGLDQKTGSELYMFVDQQGGAPPTMNIVLRTALPLETLSRTIERAVREVDRTVPIVRLRDMDAVFAESIRRPRLLAQLLGAFAALALLLAAIGTYGVLAYVVAERRREIGIRMALGAGRSSVLTQVMTEGLKLTGIGVIVGLAGAFAVDRLMAPLLFGVAPTDGTTIAAVIPTITLVAIVACWLPAWQAARLDPSVVLRDG